MRSTDPSPSPWPPPNPAVPPPLSNGPARGARPFPSVAMPRHERYARIGACPVGAVAVVSALVDFAFLRGIG